MSDNPVIHKPPVESPAKEHHEVLPTLFGEGYGVYEIKKGSFVASFLLNTAGIALLIWMGSWAATHTTQIKQQVTNLSIDISPYVMPESKDQVGGGGGGGTGDKLPASKGALPKLAKEQFTPPTVIRPQTDPKLAVEPTVVVPPQIKLPQGPVIGDPMSKIVGAPSNGPGFGGGIGSGSGGGIGSGTGPGVGPGHGGGIGGGAYRVGGGVSAPKVLFNPDPEFSEEARKAKYQGTVLLGIIVGVDGRPRNIQVLQSLGMGLDEKAVEAVRQWRFEPGRKDGQPVPVQVAIQVNFRLF